METLLPLLDASNLIPFCPSAVRYHRKDDRVWAVATLNNQDYVTIACNNIANAREQGLLYGRLYKVIKWTSKKALETSLQSADAKRLV